MALDAGAAGARSTGVEGACSAQHPQGSASSASCSQQHRVVQQSLARLACSAQVAAAAAQGHSSEAISERMKARCITVDMMRGIHGRGKAVRRVPYTFRMSSTAARADAREIDALVRLDPTPLVPIEVPAAGRVIWCKAEYQHPSGSTKDRIAAHILGKAWREGRLRAGDEVVEASSGSTSIAMSMVCARLGLRFTAFMPEGVSTERSLMIRAYGGEVRLTPKADGIVGALAACRAHAQRQGSFEPRQFENHENAEAHRRGTAAEIVRQVPGGRVDAFVSGVGTGGTIVGMRLGFADAGLRPRAVAARPVAGSRGACCDCFAAVEQCSFSSRIPGVLDDMSAIYRPADFAELQVVEVADDAAIEATRLLIRQGHPVGPSSGLNLSAAIEASRTLPASAVIVTVLCDRMERYFSTELFGEWASGNR